MWVLVARAARPDADYWPGRRFLAGIDAVAWPLIVIFLLCDTQQSTGLLGPTATSLAALTGLARLRTAIWFNGRYRFTSWLVLRIVGVLILLGLALKLLIH